MMKIRIITMLISSLAMFITSRKPIILPQTFQVYINQIGPYEKYQADQAITFKEVSTYQEELVVYEIFRFTEGDGSNLQTTTKPYHTIPADSSYTSTFNLPTSLLLGDKGLTITVDAYDYERSLRLYTKTVTIYPIGHTIVNPTKMDSYSTQNIIAKISNNTVTYTKEEFTFTNMEDYFLTDVYYKMPINQFSFTTTIKKEDFTYSNAYLIMSKMNAYFPSLPYLNKKTVLNLNANYGTSEITLSFKDQLYVEPKILQMAVLPKTGYVQTNNFYFPVNHLDDLDGKSFTFQINDIGINKTCLRWNTKLLTSGALIGKCHNSSYCVTGRVTQ